MKQTRIYKPGARPADNPPRTDAEAHSGQSRNGTGHASGEGEAKPFPLHCLPEPIGDMARAIMATERTPASLAGICTLGFLSAAIGKGLDVQSGPDRRTRGNLDLLASAESGSGKSETFRHAAKPFFEFEAEKLLAWRTSTLPRLAAEKDMLEAEIGRLKKDAGRADPDKRGEIRDTLEAKKQALAEIEAQLHAPAFTVEDCTTEKLAALLAANGETLFSVSPDAGSIVNNLLGRYSSLDRTDESIYLKAYTGDFLRVDRQKNPEPILLKSPCLAALWLTQPDKLETLLGKKELTEGGFIARLLVSHTNARPRKIGQGTPPIPAEVSAAYRRTIRALLKAYRIADEPRTIAPSPDALALLDGHFDSIVDRWESGETRDVSSYAARWGEQAWRLAVCLHAGEWGAQAHEQTLEAETAARAIELAEWFAAQQLEILSAGRDAGRRKLRDEVLALLADKPTGITARDVQRARITRTAEEAHALLATMETEGALAGADSTPDGGGHVTRLFTKSRK